MSPTTTEPQRGRTIIIEGGQYGSEGKGQIAAFIARRDKVAWAVRTGSINAGHTVHYGAHRVSMQLIPTAWTIPGVQLVLGAGCYIEPRVLAAEVARIRELSGEDVRRRLFIDHRCAWFGEAEHAASAAANRHHAMGATGKGCSEAIVTKMRDRGGERPEARLFACLPTTDEFQITDTAALLHSALRNGQHVLLEGTQGTLLDFNLGPYPFVTSRMTTAAAWLAEAGLPPTNVHTVLVLRSHPIRVAGNSGPLPGETSWPLLARAANARLARAGRPARTPDWAIEEFEATLATAITQRWPDVAAALGERAFHAETWTPGERSRFRVCLSEANAAAWALLPAGTRDALSFFELTTVTKKLRRVATFCWEDAAEAVLINDPAEIAYTFLNYDFPELDGATTTDEVLKHADACHRLQSLEVRLGRPVSTVTTGPKQAHVLSIDASLP